MKKSKLEEISNLINIRNYMFSQKENMSLDKKIVYKYISYINKLDLDISKLIIENFESNENIKNTKQSE